MERQRWQHDGLEADAAPRGSEMVTEHEVRQDREEWNVHRNDETGNLAVSRLRSTDSAHMPVIDLDVEHVYVESKTPGHAHLFINKPLSHGEYEDLLHALHKAGIIGKGIIHQFNVDGHTSARLPADPKIQRKL